MRTLGAVLLMALIAAGTASPAHAGDEQLEALVPQVSRRPFAIDPGVMPFEGE